MASTEDLHPAADNASKSLPATRQRLARMLGCDVRDASEAEWLDCARAWRRAQVIALADSWRRLREARPTLAADATVVSAGCGDFLVDDLLAEVLSEVLSPQAPRPQHLRYGQDVARCAGAEAAAWAQVCAPSVAVAALYDQEQR